MFRKSFVTFESNELSQSKFEIRRLIIFAINVQNFESKYRELTEMSRFPSGYIFLCPTLYIYRVQHKNTPP
jgi:hypothetical protein